MINPLESKQILTLAAQGMPSADIAAALELEPALVNLVLASHEAGDDRDITDDQLSFLRQRAFTLAMQNDDIGVAARMTQYLIDRDKPKIATTVSPVTAINNAIILANENFQKLKEAYEVPGPATLGPTSNGSPANQETQRMGADNPQTPSQ